MGCQTIEALLETCIPALSLKRLWPKLNPGSQASKFPYQNVKKFFILLPLLVVNSNCQNHIKTVRRIWFIWQWFELVIIHVHLTVQIPVHIFPAVAAPLERIFFLFLIDFSLLPTIRSHFVLCNLFLVFGTMTHSWILQDIYLHHGWSFRKVFSFFMLVVHGSSLRVNQYGKDEFNLVRVEMQDSKLFSPLVCNLIRCLWRDGLVFVELAAE